MDLKLDAYSRFKTGELLMFHIVLVHPEIPPNTGNIIRLCANTGCTLHLIEPLGFPLESSRLKRAGLDYHEFANLQVHRDWSEFTANENPQAQQLHALTTKSSTTIGDAKFEISDYLIFGSETKGLPQEVRNRIPIQNHWRLPMMPNSRSLNLSNSVAVVVYEAWRQHGFKNGI
jgi:tRNA (cytidine/uridine-2'-O-)-methyltransferase